MNFLQATAKSVSAVMAGFGKYQEACKGVIEPYIGMSGL
jgi:hypothetical protein